MRNRLLALAAAAALLLCLLPVAAFAAEPPSPAVHVQISPTSKVDALFLESADYPQGAAFPIPVKLAIPKGAQVTWAGEVFGGDVSKDIEAKYKVTPNKDYDEVSFMLTKSRAAQVEANWHTITARGAESQIRLAWVQRYPADTIDFGFKAPAQNSVVKMTPKWSKTGRESDGLTFYATAPLKLPVGKKLDLSISYTGQPGGSGQTGQQPGQNPAQGGVSNNLAIGIFVVLVGGGAVAATIFTQMKKGR